MSTSSRYLKLNLNASSAATWMLPETMTKEQDVAMRHLFNRG